MDIENELVYFLLSSKQHQFQRENITQPQFCADYVLLEYGHCQEFEEMLLANSFSFLEHSLLKSFESKQYPERCHFVIGNQSADLDSVVSAIVYAFYLQKVNVKSGVQYIPVISIKDDELELRTDVMALLNKYSIPKHALTFLNTVCFLDVIGRSEVTVQVTLVDHNSIHKNMIFLKEYVSEIIDHHEDSQEFNDILKNIQKVGSCATLICEELHHNNNKQNVLSVPPIGGLLLSAILVDTHNLDLHNGRTVELDTFMAEILSGYCSDEPDSLFAFLMEAKLNISSMSTYNILRMDYKDVQFQRANKSVGISSVTLEPNILLSRDNFLDVFTTFANNFCLDVLLIMFLHFGPEQQVLREIAVVSLDADLLAKTCTFVASFKEKLNLHLLSSKKCICLYNQKNVKSSRKVVLPIVQGLWSSEEAAVLQNKERVV